MTKREVVLDTETTGLDPATDRIVEIGCVELIDGIRTGRTFRRYVNPCRAVPYSAFLIHGLDDPFLRDKPVFAAIADDLLAFIGKAPLVMHNAPFDIGMLNAELERIGREPMTNEIVDTLKMPGGNTTLDKLCQRFGISLSKRQKHGALIDAKLLAKVYVGLCGGRQAVLDVTAERKLRALDGITPAQWTQKLVYPTAEEAAAWAAFIAGIDGALWSA